LSDAQLIKVKQWGFGDRYIANLFTIKEKQVRDRRLKIGVKECYEAVTVSGVNDAAYYYST